MKKKRSLISIIQFGICFFMSLSLILIGVLWFKEKIKHVQFHEEEIRETYIENRKETIQKEVKQIIDQINYKKGKLEKRVQKRVRDRTEVAYQIAQYHYERNKENVPFAAIAKLIRDNISAISWNEGAGYYFVESVNSTDLQSGNGAERRQKKLAVARSPKKEGFYSYNEKNPSDPEVNGLKIAHVKYFEPLDLILGNGMYLHDEEKRMKQEVIEHLEKLSLAGKRYLFVGTLKGVVVSGPGKGKNMWDITDANGLKIVQELIAQAKNGGGFVHYVMPKLKGQRPDPKISYSAAIPDWHWYIGTGVYVDSIENEIAHQKENFNKSIQRIIIQAVWILGLLSLLSYLSVWLFAKKIERNFDLFVEFFRKSAFEQLTIPPEKVSFHEFQSLALSANQMVVDRQNARKEKEKSEERFRQMLENIKDVYFETTIDGLISYCSPSCLEISGYAQGELIGQNTSILYSNVDDRQLLLAPLQKFSKVRDLELVFQKKDGSLFDASFNADLVLDKEGVPLGIRGTIRDVTTAKSAKEQLQRAKKMEAIGLMAGGVAHDLNNILSGIVGYPELLLQTLPPNSDMRNSLEAIQESGQRAVTVVADLLTVARGAASIREVHDLNILIEEQLHSPECKELKMLHPNISYQPQFMATQPSVSCSPVHVKKCIMNLLINAAEAIKDDGTIYIATRNQQIDHITAVRQQMEAGDYVVLNVEDTGSGISDIDLKHIFEPFYTKKKMGRSGTGLGLAVVWNTMHDHQGKIVVKSSDKGTSFTLYFPVNKGTADVQCQSRNDLTETLAGKGERILVVDDEPQLRDIGSQMLQTLGYRVDSVDSGEQAIAYVKKEAVDLIVLDMRMEPGINGRETYEEIINIHPGQKAIIASGFSENDEVRTALRLGVGGFIHKPYSMDQLGQAVKDALS